MDKFAVFILTHGRPDNVVTYKTLRRCGYTGEIYIIVDNEDETLSQYYVNYGNQVIVFDKEAIAKTFDEAGIFEDRRAVVYARNASWDIAKELGLDYFLQLDDDYSTFRFQFDKSFIPSQKETAKLDDMFSILLKYYKSIPALSIAIGQGADYRGGIISETVSSVRTRRKAMNTFFCATDRPFQFLGRINEDVNTYINLGNRGKLFLTILQIGINQTSTQQNAGGMSDLYLGSGSYIKSFYTVMFNPSCVTVQETHTTHKRLHHRINWNNAVPKILSETHKIAIK